MKILAMLAGVPHRTLIRTSGFCSRLLAIFWSSHWIPYLNVPIQKESMGGDPGFFKAQTAKHQGAVSKKPVLARWRGCVRKGCLGSVTNWGDS